VALTPKQQIFIEEYLSTWNATEAARRAGYQGNDASLATIGWENLRKLEIADAIKKRLSEAAMPADEVLMRLAQHGRADMGQWLTDDGQLDVAAMKRDKATHLIHKVKRTERSGETNTGGTWSHVTVEVELHPAQSALSLLGKHHGLFKDVSEVKGEFKITDATDARERIHSRIAGIAERKRASGVSSGLDS
jgi:phage terminase small subunit